jgi:CheY-like chemotaxis protein
VRRLPSVLVVDPDTAAADALATVLFGMADVVVARTAEDGASAAAHGGFSAVVVEQALPDLAGVELVRQLRTDPRTLTTPLLVVTGHDDAALDQQARAAGADDVLRKPVPPADLAAWLRPLLPAVRTA